MAMKNALGLLAVQQFDRIFGGHEFAKQAVFRDQQIRVVTLTIVPLIGHDHIDFIGDVRRTGYIVVSKIGIARQIDDIENIKEDLVKMKWSGWVIKSAIINRKEIKND